MAFTKHAATVEREYVLMKGKHQQQPRRAYVVRDTNGDWSAMFRTVGNAFAYVEKNVAVVSMTADNDSQRYEFFCDHDRVVEL